MDHAVAITGMGMVTAQGIGVEASWRGVVGGQDRLQPWGGRVGAPPDHPLAKIKVASCPPLSRPPDLPPRLWRTLSRTQQLAALAADEALTQAGLPRNISGARTPAPRSGLFLATTICGMDINEQFYAQYRVDPDRADIHLIRRIQPYEALTLLFRRHRLGSPLLRNVNLSTCVGSAMAIGDAMDAIALGQCDLALAGGSEALCRVVLSGFHALKIVAPDGCRPFDDNRPGITVGEGAAMLVLESLSHARRRGANVLAHLRGFATTCDAHHITAPDPTARHAVRAMQLALQRAKIDPATVRYLNAHGTGTRDNDSVEARAIQSVFGPAPPPISSTKRCTGHTFGAAGAIEAIFCVQAIRHGIAPPNTGSLAPDKKLWTGPDPVIRGPALRKRIDVAMSTNFAFGGNNTALLFSKGTGFVSAPFPRAAARPAIPEHPLAILGLGLVTDAYASAAELAQSLAAPPQLLAHVQRAQALNPDAVAAHDVLPQLAIRAVHQAWTMAAMDQADPDRVGLLFMSGWGMIDSTVAYLDSMFDADGRYASPRHFSRSVYCSAASILAIHFQIHGPCETLAFDERESPVTGALAHAWRLLAADRADRVIVVWAEQAAPVALDLARRAAQQLGRHEYDRYLPQGLGQGAVALILASHNAPQAIAARDAREPSAVARQHLAGKPYAMDAALQFLATLLTKG